jgi:hypothetical protein
MHAPTLEDFLAAPPEQIAAVAPATVIFAPGGTRRGAALAGIAPHSDDYARWSRDQMIACAQRFFALGTRHLFMSIMRPRQLAEVGRYRERLLDWIDWGVAGPEALADYRRHGWRVRLLGAASLPELQPAANRLSAENCPLDAPTLWFYAVPEADSTNQWLLDAMRRTTAHDSKRLQQALYGEDIPPATIYIGFGKPILVPDLLPPLIAGEAQCYWLQQPGYAIDETTIRRIFYDCAYLRSTWTLDKSARYHDLETQRDLWERPAVLGLGRRVGAFWYPQARLGDPCDG